MTSTLQTSRSIRSNRGDRSARASFTSDSPLPENQFLAAISQERQRSERSKKPFLLMLPQLSPLPEIASRIQLVNRTIDVVRNSIRATDVIGWHQHQQVLGIIFTHPDDAAKDPAPPALKTP